MTEFAPGRISQPDRPRTECDTPPRLRGGGGGRLEKCIAPVGKHWGFRSILNNQSSHQRRQPLLADDPGMFKSAQSGQIGVKAVCC